MSRGRHQGVQAAPLVSRVRANHRNGRKAELFHEFMGLARAQLKKAGSCHDYEVGDTPKI
jgi:hypothetical protein